eukprot:CAMPEP_0178953392 /NCGR_PEP_ID=MMETSP0789-20121207/8392_1 /TAXON_ID=3005 /ORGANISM="Rhizosolenia setigera, Strain CCMP 1694" /LENGTH=650 /DNA_ID=CAMNT_0020634643 /DNA_START=155 /DNA_END=2107 /DNA_ORIENTATION=+
MTFIYSFLSSTIISVPKTNSLTFSNFYSRKLLSPSTTPSSSVFRSITTTSSSSRTRISNNFRKSFTTSLHASLQQNEIINKNPSTSTLSSSSSSSVQPSESDTIFALSSGGGGEGGAATAVAVIRISGPQSLKALQMLTSPLPSSSPSKPLKPRYAHLRTLYEYNSQEILDQALVLYFPGPNSFSGEDIIELHTHGSRAVVSDVLSTLGSLPGSPSCFDENNDESLSSSNNYLLRPADRGEFTQRAYMNGKLGLVEVEALADLIVSDTSMQRRQALKQMDGRVTKIYESWREELIKGLAHAEAVIDFGDDEDLTSDDNDYDYDDDGDDDNDHFQKQAQAESKVWGNVRNRISDLLDTMNKFLQDENRGEIVRDGIRIAIVGPPNAGKSSLLNILTKRDVAIVSPKAGTTRDVVEVILDLGGVRCILSDTAGVREDTQGDFIEEEGIKRAKQTAQNAHVVIFMKEASDEKREDVTSTYNDEIESLLGLNKNLPEGQQQMNGEVLKVNNKVDLLTSSPTPTSGTKSEDNNDEYNISCTSGHGIDALLDKITQIVVSRVSPITSSSSSPSSSSLDQQESIVITRARHRRHIQETADALSRFMELTAPGQQNWMTVDMAAEELRLATTEIGRITGSVDVEDVLDVLFADFCIGK